MPSDLLNSWKEIANYLGRGVRTAQRWERQAGLPVRRLNGKSRSAVLAFPADIDAWLHSQAATRNGSVPARPAASDELPPPHDMHDQLLRNAEQLAATVALLQSQLAIALEESKRAYARLARARPRRPA